MARTDLKFLQAAWGGGLLLSPEHRYHLAGIERANSVTWNPHKLMGTVLQCSACFIRQEVRFGLAEKSKVFDVSLFQVKRGTQQLVVVH